jgi:hypothetical protein
MSSTGPPIAIALVDDYDIVVKDVANISMAIATLWWSPTSTPPQVSRRGWGLVARPM